MPAFPENLIDAAARCGLIEADEAARLRGDLRERRLADPLEAITRACRAPPSALYRALAEARGLPFLDGAALDAPAALLARVPELVVRRKRVLPLAEEADRIL